MQDEFRVYGRDGEPCRRCGATIAKTRSAAVAPGSAPAASHSRQAERRPLSHLHWLGCLMPRSRASGCAIWRVRAVHRPDAGREAAWRRACASRRESGTEASGIAPLSRRAPERPARAPETAISWHQASDGSRGQDGGGRPPLVPLRRGRPRAPRVHGRPRPDRRDREGRPQDEVAFWRAPGAVLARRARCFTTARASCTP